MVKAGAENLILRFEGGVQNSLKDATAPKSLYFKVLTFNPFRTRGAQCLTVMVVFRNYEWLVYGQLCPVPSEY